jgi:site-specific DNA recombinase
VGLQPEPKTIELSLDVVRGAGGVEIATGKQSGDIPRRLNPALINGVARGYLWRNRLLGGEVGSIVEIARRARVSPRYVIRMMRMGFLAPDIIEAILEGRQTAAVTVEVFRKPIPLDWSEQRLILGFVE